MVVVESSHISIWLGGCNNTRGECGSSQGYNSFVILGLEPRLHEHQVPNPDSNLDHNPHGRGGLSLDLNPVCFRVNATSLDQDLNQNPRVRLRVVDILCRYSLTQ